MLWFKQYKLVFVILLLILFIALFISSPSSVEGFDSGYSAIIAADVVFQDSLDKLNTSLSTIVNPTPSPKYNFNNTSANTKIVKPTRSSKYNRNSTNAKNVNPTPLSKYNRTFSNAKIVNPTLPLEDNFNRTSSNAKIVKPILPLEDDFNSHSANAIAYKTQLSSLKTQMSHIKDRRNAMGNKVNYTDATVSAATDVGIKLDLLLVEVGKFKHYLPYKMKKILNNIRRSVVKLHEFVQKPDDYYSIDNITTADCKKTPGGVTNCKYNYNVGYNLTLLMLPVVDYKDIYSGNGIVNPKKLVLTTSDLSTNNSTLKEYIVSVEELVAFINKLEKDPMMPDKKTELMVFTTDIKTKIDKLKEYIKNYDQNKVATVNTSSISPADASAGRVAVSASPVATVVNK